MKTRSVIKTLSSTIGARLNCIESNNSEWEDRHENTIKNIIDNYLPHGSGIDSGNEIDFKKSTANKIVINSSFHTMDQQGGYSGWIDFKVIIKASLQFDFDLTIKGMFSKNKDSFGLKDYLYGVYGFALSQNYKNEV